MVSGIVQFERARKRAQLRTLPPLCVAQDRKLIGAMRQAVDHSPAGLVLPSG
jgi:hypothetical protein